ncbi:MAG: DNA internalization-related competence protein ComEC/Rec2 [Sideroxydans sp.]|nr:DNA internalization-related competence protein ComEC/Rec2 [Sideroxydans sp.]
MAGFAIFFALGIWLLQQQAQLPSLAWAWLLLPLALLPWLLRRDSPGQRVARHGLILALAFGLGFGYAAFVARQHLAEQLPAAWQGKNIEIIGVVAELPRQHERGLSFGFDVEKTRTPGVEVPPHILLATYSDKSGDTLPLHAGERWQFTVRLKQPHGTANPHTFDFEAWMLERDLRASGYVRSDGDNRRLDGLVATPRYLIEHLREAVRARFQRILGNAPYTGVLSALAVGDQSSIPQAQWQVFTRTGVNHLMSISGLHITMLGSLAFFIAYQLWRRSTRLTLRLPARKAAAIAGLLVALAYALLSGFSVPAQRTVYMLATVALALLSSRNIAPSQLLAAALTVVLLADPWAVMAPGFWLSFGAVALILYVTANRIGKTHWLLEYGKVQWAMTIGLVPPLLAMFQQVSLVSPLANAFAIPLVSFIVVPLTLLGALLPFDWLLQLAHLAMNGCMQVLEWLNQLPEAVWRQHAPPAWSIALGMFGVLWCLLPRGFPARWLGLLLLLPMFLVLPAAPGPGALWLTVFDVGQGLSVAAQTGTHVLLYDTGPDFPGDADSGNRIVVPALHARGIAQLDGLMLTHDDADHIGGAYSVLQAMPTGWISSSLPARHPLLQNMHNTQHCIAGQHWEWDGVQFEVLHPSRESYAIGKIRDNERGCVLRISTGVNSVLLAADIEKGSEQQLLRDYAGKLPATLLVVPHHGSKTSSTPAFVAAVHPRYAVFTSGYRNRFGHPNPEVVARYRQIGSELLRSDDDGAIQVEMDGSNFRLERFRALHRRYWYPQAE